MEKAEEVGAAAYSTAIGTERERAGTTEKADGEERKESAREGRLARERKEEKETRRGRPSNAERLQRGRAGSEGSILEYYGRKRDHSSRKKRKAETKLESAVTVRSLS